MKKRKIIDIDEDKCDGCGLCIPNCPEGALRVIDGKVRLISDLLCDGLGACLGECPKGAIKVIEREAVDYDEVAVMKNMLKQGANTVKAHMKHLQDHGQDVFLKQAVDFLKEKGIANPLEENMEKNHNTCVGAVSKGHAPQTAKGHGASHKPAAEEKSPCGCPGAREMTFGGEDGEERGGGTAAVKSQLRQWPVQLHLVSTMAPYFKKADVVLAADCVAYSYGNFHNDFLKGKALAIACPKLDEGQESYVEKLTELIDSAGINTLTVITMEVPCCGGLVAMAQEALGAAKRKVPVKHVMMGLEGEVKSENWISA